MSDEKKKSLKNVILKLIDDKFMNLLEAHNSLKSILNSKSENKELSSAIMGKLILLKTSFDSLINQTDNTIKFISEDNNLILSATDIKKLENIDKANQLFEKFLPSMLVYSISQEKDHA